MKLVGGCSKSQRSVTSNLKSGGAGVKANKSFKAKQKWQKTYKNNLIYESVFWIYTKSIHVLNFVTSN